MLAAFRGHTGILTRLLGHGASLDEQGKWGETAFDIASKAKHPEVMAVLEEASKMLPEERVSKWGSLAAEGVSEATAEGVSEVTAPAAAPEAAPIVLSAAEANLAATSSAPTVRKNTKHSNSTRS